MNEIWKEIPGYEGYFEVSNLGNFRSMDRIVKYKNNGLRKYPGKPLKVEQMQDGYQRIVLMKEAIKKRYMCHRLVALAFIENIQKRDLPILKMFDNITRFVIDYSQKMHDGLILETPNISKTLFDDD